MSDIKTPKSEGGTVRWLKSMFSKADRKSKTADASLQEEQLKKLPPVERKNKTVLVVDDDPIFLKAASMRLNADGYDVITAKEGSEAIQIARKQKPDALVLDVNLPRDVAGVPWDGFTVMEWLRRFDELKNVPVIIASDSDPAKVGKKVSATGATAFFEKRMDPRHLITFVTRGIQQPRLATATTNTSFQI